MLKIEAMILDQLENQTIKTLQRKNGKLKNQFLNIRVCPGKRNRFHKYGLSIEIHESKMARHTFQDME